MRTITKEEFKKISKNKLVIDDNFKENKVISTNSSYCGLCYFCDTLIKSESHRVFLKAGIINQKMAHKNCLKSYIEKHGEFHV